MSIINSNKINNVKVESNFKTEKSKENILRALRKDRRFVVAISNTDADGGCSSARRRSCIHGNDDKLIDVIGPLVVQATGGADHASSCDVEILAWNEVGELRVHARVTVTSQN